ncbi:DUF1203 domain-containing protein [Sneathiella sp.]|jgi:hypothetical protein|uniref:DUF1203 domain-containing protein n=1 Tax=Sneathiella sp. TaxID=1964365 RepID=UPI0039E25865
MSSIKYTPLSSEIVEKLRMNGRDAHGNPPEHLISDGDGLPCRHCLNFIAPGEPYLVLSYKPFSTNQPYAEQGPIFLHANKCDSFDASQSRPLILSDNGAILIRGYTDEERIVYGTGQIIAKHDLEKSAAALFNRAEVAFIHVRSATNNCFQFRVDRASS